MLRDDLRGPESNHFREALVKTVKRHYARVNPKPNAISALLQEHTLGPRAHSNPISQPSHRPIWLGVSPVGSGGIWRGGQAHAALRFSGMNSE